MRLFVSFIISATRFFRQSFLTLYWHCIFNFGATLFESLHHFDGTSSRDPPIPIGCWLSASFLSYFRFELLIETLYKSKRNIFKASLNILQQHPLNTLFIILYCCSVWVFCFLGCCGCCWQHWSSRWDPHPSLFGFFLPIHLLLLFCLGILLGCFQEGSSRCCDSASKLLLFRVYTHTHTHTHTHTNGFFLFLGFPQGRQWGENLGFYCGILGLPEPPGFFFGHPTPPPPPLVHGARIKRELDIHFCGFAGAFVSYQHANNATRWSLESPWFHLHPSGQIVTCLFFLFVFGCILHA